jgi:predicted amidophosphoribosyltransferase
MTQQAQPNTSPTDLRGGWRVWLLQALALDWLVQADHPEHAAGLNGDEPLAWWASDHYIGPWRHRLLQLRRQPQQQRLQPLLPGLLRQLRQQWPASRPGPQLVVIPSWKRRCNPLPPLLGAQLSRQLRWPLAPLLQRRRPVLPQHRLNAHLRHSNQQGSFHCSQPWPAAARGRWGREVLLVDDILTTGATALAAREELERAGWLVAGLACLGRTPAPRAGRDLRSNRRKRGRPG